MIVATSSKFVHGNSRVPYILEVLRQLDKTRAKGGRCITGGKCNCKICNLCNLLFMHCMHVSFSAYSSAAREGDEFEAMLNLKVLKSKPISPS